MDETLSMAKGFPSNSLHLANIHSPGIIISLISKEHRKKSENKTKKTSTASKAENLFLFLASFHLSSFFRYQQHYINTRRGMDKKRQNTTTAGAATPTRAAVVVVNAVNEKKKYFPPLIRHPPSG